MTLTSESLLLACTALLVSCNQPSTQRFRPDASNPTSESQDASLQDLDTEEPENPWHVVFSGLDAPVLAAWESPTGGVFFVGERGLVLNRLSDGHFVRWEIEGDDSLWWVWGRNDDDVLAGGEGGTLLRFDGSRWRRVNVELNESATIWGIWGEGADVWLVGGDARSGGPGFALRGDGEHFDVVTLPDDTPNLFKVWGSAADDVFFVGDRLTMLHFDGARFERVPLPEAYGEEPLFTVAGNRFGEVFAVGGVQQGVALQRGSGKFELLPFATAGLNGVSVSDTGNVVVVGTSGVIRERRQLQWHTFDWLIDQHYHAALVLRSGDALAVGGDLLAEANLRRGVILARGEAWSGPFAEPEVRSEPRDAGVSRDASVPRNSEALDASHAALSDASSSPVDSSTVSMGPDASTPMPSTPLPSTQVDAAPADTTTTALPGPSQPCNEAQLCGPGLECWYLQGEAALVCVDLCDSANECSAEYGPNARCAPPGCQTGVTVCLRQEWAACL